MNTDTKLTYERKLVAENLNSIIEYALKNSVTGIKIEGKELTGKNAIEKALGLTVGDLSRVKNSATRNIPLRAVIKAASIFEIPADILLFTEISDQFLASRELTCEILIQRLISDIEALGTTIRRETKDGTTHFIMRIEGSLYADIYDHDGYGIVLNIYDEADPYEDPVCFCQTKTDVKTLEKLYSKLKDISNDYPIFSNEDIKMICTDEDIAIKTNAEVNSDVLLGNIKDISNDYPSFFNEDIKMICTDEEVAIKTNAEVSSDVLLGNIKYLMNSTTMTQKAFCSKYHKRKNFFTDYSEPEISLLVELSNDFNISVQTLTTKRLQEKELNTQFKERMMEDAILHTKTHSLKWSEYVYDSYVNDLDEFSSFWDGFFTHDYDHRPSIQDAVKGGYLPSVDSSAHIYKSSRFILSVFSEGQKTIYILFCQEKEIVSNQYSNRYTVRLYDLYNSIRKTIDGKNEYERKLESSMMRILQPNRTW